MHCARTVTKDSIFWRDTSSEDYREDTQGENDSNEGSSSDHIVELETDDFVWEDVLEEIGRFENFNVDMTFTTKIGSRYLSL